MALAPTAVPVALRAMDAATLLHALSNPLPRRVRMRMQENGCEIHGPARRTERSSTHSWASQTEKWFALSPFKDGWFSSPAAASIATAKSAAAAADDTAASAPSATALPPPPI
mmetsp:Transcript_20224/g.42699  ORF Transcript_20224/g.42699 Transcript_20224/m.42699 type:complete len:113 (+) Transcript_20224:327-665(+)